MKCFFFKVSKNCAICTKNAHRAQLVNRYRRKRPKVDASIFDSALSHTRRSDVSEKKEENSVSTFGRFRLWTSFESSPVSLTVQVRQMLSVLNPLN